MDDGRIRDTGAALQLTCSLAQGLRLSFLAPPYSGGNGAPCHSTAAGHGHMLRRRSVAGHSFFPRCRPLTTHTTALLDRSIGSGQICLDLISWIGRNIGSVEDVKYWIGLVGSIGIFFFFFPPAFLHRDRENIKLSTMHC
jgi:hypothetical protein